MATSAPKASKQPEAAAEQAPGKRGKLFLILPIVLLLIAAAGGGAAWYFLAGSNASHGGPAKSKPKPTAPPVFLALETFTVNLQTEDPSDQQQQFLQLNMTLQVVDEAQAEMIKQNMPQVRNRLLILLSSKKAAEILSVEGKRKLAEDILKQVRQPFVPEGPHPEVSDVFFTSFVVQ
ncbi:MAG TPA: flagellar basal body-associated protein FliL [Noviherbaspirillum sp.]